MFDNNATTYTKAKSFDPGLRQYMLMVYNYLACALAITGVSAMTAYGFKPLFNLLFNVGANGEFYGMTGIGMLVTFAPLGIAMYFFMGFAKLETHVAKNLFWAYAALTGMASANLFLMYTGASIAKTFFICSASFAGMSAYGYSTNKDLTSWGSFLSMGVIGLLVASLLNIFFQSEPIYFATSLLGVVIFLGLIAYDTQRLKAMYYQVGGGLMGQKMAVMAALSLYLNFINLFFHLIRFFGVRRSD